jgi:hypothetical protein
LNLPNHLIGLWTDHDKWKASQLAAKLMLI